METKSRSLFNNALIFGLLTAAVSVVFSVITYIIDLPYGSPVMYLSFVILLGGMLYGTLQYRNNYAGGYISFGNAFLSGFLIVLVAAFISAVYSYVFTSFIDPAFLEKIVEMTMEKTETDLISKGLSEEQIEPALAMTRKMMSSTAISIMAFLSSALVGAIVALIAAIFVKKEDTSFDGQFKNVE